MRGWTLFTGAPRFGDAPPAERAGAGKGSVASRLAAARRWGALAALSVVWALAGAGVRYAPPSWTPADLALRVAVPCAVVFVALALAGFLGARAPLRRRVSGALERAGWLGGTLALSAAVAALLRGPWSWTEGARAALPDALAQRVGAHAFLPTGALLAAGVLLPLAFALLSHACALALDVGGTAPRRAPLLRALSAVGPEGFLLPKRGRALASSLGLLRLLARALSYPSLLLTDAVVTAGHRLRALAAAQSIDRLHLAVAPHALAQALSAAGVPCVERGRRLHLTLPKPPPTEVAPEGEALGFARVLRVLTQGLSQGLSDERAEAVHIVVGELRFPRLATPGIVDVRGHPRAVRRLRRLLETDLVHVGVFSWSAEAARLEARINAFARDVAMAATADERRVLLEEANALDRQLRGRAFLEEEWTILAAWKLTPLRLRLQGDLLAGLKGARESGILLLPAPAIPPPRPRLVEAAPVRSITLVPYWIVPFRTVWGEQEVAVNALLQRLDRRETVAVLAHARASGASYFADGSRVARVLPAPPHTGALYGEVRRVLRHELGYWGPLAIDEALVEPVYVPFDLVDGRPVNALTGREAPEILAMIQSPRAREAARSEPAPAGAR